MPGASEYERHQIESLLQTGQITPQHGLGLFLAPELSDLEAVHPIAVLPAMQANEINQTHVVRVLDSDSSLNEICGWVQSAEVIVADVSAPSADLMYILGLCHGLRRCPLLICLRGTPLPFNLSALRCIEYRTDREDLWELREQLTRAIRVFLTATRAKSVGQS